MLQKFKNIFKKEVVVENDSDNINKVEDNSNNEKDDLLNEYYKTDLLPRLKNHENNDILLYKDIIEGMEHGLTANIIAYINTYASISFNREKGAILLANAYLDINDRSKAKHILESYFAHNSRTADALSLLAKILISENNSTAKDVVYEAFKLDKNNERLLSQYMLFEIDATSDKTYLDLLKSVKRKKDSWLANFYIARDHLENGRLKRALNIYEKNSIKLSYDNILLMVVNDLKNNKYYEECYNICYPLYKTGINDDKIGKALLEPLHRIGKINEGKDIYDYLVRKNLLINKDILDNYEKVYCDKTVQGLGRLLTELIEKPIWFYGLQKEYLSLRRTSNKKIGLLGMKTPLLSYTYQSDDTLNKLAYSIPLLISEYINFYSDIDYDLIINCEQGKGLKRFNKDLGSADYYALCEKYNLDYMICGSLNVEGLSYAINYQFYTKATNSISTTKSFISQDMSKNNPFNILNEIAIYFDIDLFKDTTFFKSVENKELDLHLKCLYNNLIQTLVMKDPTSINIIENENEIFDDYIKLVKEYPSKQNLLMLLSGLYKSKNSNSITYLEYKDITKELINLELFDDFKQFAIPFSYNIFDERDKLKKYLFITDDTKVEKRYFMWLKNL